jgi:hypothetical protein
VRFLIMGQHPPDLCPTSNAKVREIANDAARELESTAQRHGVRVVDTFLTQTSHHVFLLVDADGIEPVRRFAMQSRLGQWNTLDIYATNTLDETLEAANEIPPIY